MTRAERALRRAPDSHVLARLPRADIAAVVHREHADRPRGDRGCWWFSSIDPGAEPLGRFDLPAPRGTLYVAETAGAAARERCGRFLAAGTPIPVDDVEGRVVSRMTAALSGLGDLTSPDAAAIGVTAEIHSVDDYSLTTAWSAGADAAGLRGLRYTPRFTPGGEAAFAVFGPAGNEPPAGFDLVDVAPLADVLADLGVMPREPPSTVEAVDDTVGVPDFPPTVGS